MSNLSSEPDVLISRASHRPRQLLEAMITISDAQTPAKSALADRVSSLGILNRLPPEVMFMVLGMLDIPSIANFARVSFRGNSCIQSLRAYQDLVTFAPQALVALGRVGLIRLHSVAELYAALRTERCSSCAEYGAFLFLLTCKRGCWECLRHNPSLRALPPKEAMRYFGLSKKQIKRLPTLFVLPANYDITRNPSPQDCRLVSVKAARELGLVVHGSAEQLAQAMARRCKSGRLLVTGQFYQSEPAVSQSQDLLLMPSQGNIPPADFFGMASIPFPSLSASGRVENGLWCRGCEITRHRYDSVRLPRDVLAALVSTNCEAMRVLLGLERRARSRESFLEHAKQCYGIQQLVPRLTIGND
ncbi:hypothetical protein FDECE_9340 [Fusarium decemcellulare]|nr:hypothetical protein FDECE_9340 [Fusarium decemcellulare]